VSDPVRVCKRKEEDVRYRRPRTDKNGTSVLDSLNRLRSILQIQQQVFRSIVIRELERLLNILDLENE